MSQCKKIAVTLSPSAEIYMYMHDILLYTYVHVGPQNLVMYIHIIIRTVSGFTIMRRFSNVTASASL